MSSHSYDDLDEKTKEVIDKFHGLDPDTEATPNSVVLRDAEGNIKAAYVKVSNPDAETIEGAIAFRTSDADGTVRFCNDKQQVRRFLGLIKVTVGDEEPTNPGVGDVWITE